MCAAHERNSPSAPRARPPEIRLVRAAVRGEPDAVRELFALLRPLVLGYCSSRLGRRESGHPGAEDCTQEVMYAVLAVLPRYPYRADRFLSWVFGIAAHKIADAHRSRHRDHRRCVPLPDPTADELVVPAADEYEHLDQQLQVQPLFRHLPETHRRVLAMRVVLGYSAEETARLLGMPSATAVRVAQFRAIKRLRAVLPGPS